MGKCLKLCVLALVCTMTFGCATKNYQREDDSMRAEQRFRRSYEAAFDNNEQQGSQQLLRKARSAIGTPYVRGGMSPGGFDCSGFVCWAYKSVGVSLPRTAREQSVIGKRISNVEDMRVGDIVAFRHPRRGYHTGIYVGDGKFIHSPRRRTTVRINSLNDPYFKGTFLGARRVKMDGTENLVAEAETRLNDYAEERAVRDIYRKHKASSRSSLAGNDDHRKKSGKDSRNAKNNNRSKKKNPSNSRDSYVEVASLDKKHSSTRKSDVEKAGRHAAKSSGKSSARENKTDKKGNSSASQSRSSKPERDKSVQKNKSRKSDAAKADQRKPENRKSEAAKSNGTSGASRSGASKGESAHKNKTDANKTASSKSENGKSKKTPAKNRDNNS